MGKSQLPVTTATKDLRPFSDLGRHPHLHAVFRAPTHTHTHKELIITSQRIKLKIYHFISYSKSVSYHSAFSKRNEINSSLNAYYGISEMEIKTVE